MEKAHRVDLSRQLLRMLEIRHGRAWYDIVTLGERWFYLTTDHELIWPSREEPVLERDRYTVQSKG
jgi:hypothetical protein